MTRRRKHESARSIRRAEARKAKKAEPRSHALDNAQVRIITPEQKAQQEYAEKIIKAAKATHDMGLIIPGVERQSR
jgi:hypothetical protein